MSQSSSDRNVDSDAKKRSLHQNFTSRYKYELLFAIASALISLILALVPLELDIFKDWSNAKIVFVMLSGVASIVAIAATRLRMNVDAQTEQIHRIVDAQSTDLKKLIEDFAEVSPQILDASRNLGKFVRKLPPEASIVLHELISPSQMIEPVIDLYRHDTEQIEKLGEGETYKATHLYLSENKDDSDLPKSINDKRAAFSAYIEAQCNAVKRGVKVTRIYIFNNRELPKEAAVLAHLRKLVDHKIDVRILGAQSLDNSKTQDFVLIGKKHLGLGECERGILKRARMYTNSRGMMHPKYVEYDRYFRELLSASVTFEELGGILEGVRSAQTA